MDTRLFQGVHYSIFEQDCRQRQIVQPFQLQVMPHNNMCGERVIQRITQYEKTHKIMGKIYFSIVFHGHITIMRLVSTYDLLVKA